MKILVIDNDNERISTLKSLELNGHLVQAVESLLMVKDVLNSYVCQMLMLGPEQASGEPLKIFSEWRQSFSEETRPLVVALGAPRQGLVGVDHYFSIPFDKIDTVELLGLKGVPPEPEAVNTARALEICDDDEELFREITDIFLKDGPGRMETLNQGLGSKDWKAVMETAHLMKGSALNLAADSFRIANQNLERAANSGSDIPLILFWYDQVVYEYGRLESHLKGLPGGSV